MGLFGRGFQKEGPGVSKDASQKRKFFLFFELYFRKFWKLIQLNMLYFIVNILSVLAICVMLMSLSIQQEPGVIDGVALIAYGVLVLSGIILGPSTVAMCYVLRNYSNERHSFLMSDFFEHFKKNFKQAIPVGILSTIIPALFIFAIMYYSSIEGVMGIILLSVTAFCILIVASAFLYIYPVMVTFDLKLKDIIKNSIILALANFPVNIFVLIVDALILWGVTGYLSVYLVAVLCMFILPATLGFINVFSVWGAIDKYLMPKKEDAEDEEEKVFSDERILK